MKHTRVLAVVMAAFAAMFMYCGDNVVQIPGGTGGSGDGSDGKIDSLTITFGYPEKNGDGDSVSIVINASKAAKAYYRVSENASAPADTKAGGKPFNIAKGDQPYTWAIPDNLKNLPSVYVSVAVVDAKGVVSGNTRHQVTYQTPTPPGGSTPTDVPPQLSVATPEQDDYIDDDGNKVDVVTVVIVSDKAGSAYWRISDNYSNAADTRTKGTIFAVSQGAKPYNFPIPAAYRTRTSLYFSTVAVDKDGNVGWNPTSDQVPLTWTAPTPFSATVNAINWTGTGGAAVTLTATGDIEEIIYYVQTTNVTDVTTIVALGTQGYKFAAGDTKLKTTSFPASNVGGGSIVNILVRGFVAGEEVVLHANPNEPLVSASFTVSTDRLPTTANVKYRVSGPSVPVYWMASPTALTTGLTPGDFVTSGTKIEIPFGGWGAGEHTLPFTSLTVTEEKFVYFRAVDPANISRTSPVSDVKILAYPLVFPTLATNFDSRTSTTADISFTIASGLEGTGDDPTEYLFTTSYYYFVKSATFDLVTDEPATTFKARLTTPPSGDVANHVASPALTPPFKTVVTGITIPADDAAEIYVVVFKEYGSTPTPIAYETHKIVVPAFDDTPPTLTVSVSRGTTPTEDGSVTVKSSKDGAVYIWTPNASASPPIGPVPPSTITTVTDITTGGGWVELGGPGEGGVAAGTAKLFENVLEDLNAFGKAFYFVVVTTAGSNYAAGLFTASPVTGSITPILPVTLIKGKSGYPSGAAISDARLHYKVNAGDDLGDLGSDQFILVKHSAVQLADYNDGANYFPVSSATAISGTGTLWDGVTPVAFVAANHGSSVPVTVATEGGYAYFMLVGPDGATNILEYELPTAFVSVSGLTLAKPTSPTLEFDRISPTSAAVRLTAGRVGTVFYKTRTSGAAETDAAVIIGAASTPDGGSFPVTTATTLISAGSFGLADKDATLDLDAVLVEYVNSTASDDLDYANKSTPVAYTIGLSNAAIPSVTHTTKLRNGILNTATVTFTSSTRARLYYTLDETFVGGLALGDEVVEFIAEGDKTTGAKVNKLELTNQSGVSQQFDLSFASSDLPNALLGSPAPQPLYYVVVPYQYSSASQIAVDAGKAFDGVTIPGNVHDIPVKTLATGISGVTLRSTGAGVILTNSWTGVDIPVGTVIRYGASTGAAVRPDYSSLLTYEFSAVPGSSVLLDGSFSTGQFFWYSLERKTSNTSPAPSTTIISDYPAAALVIDD